MPYIADSKSINLLLEIEEPENAGELTFLLQQLIQDYLRLGPLRYSRLAEVLGAIEGLKADFIDRVLIPYERKKRAENGDVWDLGITGAVAGAHVDVIQEVRETGAALDTWPPEPAPKGEPDVAGRDLGPACLDTDDELWAREMIRRGEESKRNADTTNFRADL